MSPPVLVMTNVAVPVLILLQEPLTDNDGGVIGVLVGVEVGVLVGVLVGAGVKLGVAVSGTLIQEPVTLRVTDANLVVLYVTIIVPLPAPSMVVLSPAPKLSEPLLLPPAGSE